MQCISTLSAPKGPCQKGGVMAQSLALLRHNIGTLESDREV